MGQRIHFAYRAVDLPSAFLPIWRTQHPAFGMLQDKSCTAAGSSPRPDFHFLNAFIPGDRAVAAAAGRALRRRLARRHGPARWRRRARRDVLRGRMAAASGPRRGAPSRTPSGRLDGAPPEASVGFGPNERATGAQCQTMQWQWATKTLALQRFLLRKTRRRSLCHVGV